MSRSSIHTNLSFRGSILLNSTPAVVKSSYTVFTLSKAIKTDLVKFAIVVFVYNFVNVAVNIFSVSWYLLVLLININYQDIQL